VIEGMNKILSYFFFQLTLFFFIILLYDNEHSISPNKLLFNLI
jgi:hypothetical protein